MQHSTSLYKCMLMCNMIVFLICMHTWKQRALKYQVKPKQLISSVQNRFIGYFTTLFIYKPLLGTHYWSQLSGLMQHPVMCICCRMMICKTIRWIAVTIWFPNDVTSHAQLAQNKKILTSNTSVISDLFKAHGNSHTNLKLLLPPKQNGKPLPWKFHVNFAY